MIVGYARCSTQAQAEGLDGQVRYLREQMGAEKVYSEIVSGRAASRPKLDELLGFIREDDVLVVQRLDRLARSVSELIRLVGLLSDKGVHIRSGHEVIDTSTAGGRLIFHVFCSLAEFEASLIRERTMIGLEHARRKGRVGGRPRKLDRNKSAVVKAALEARSVPVRTLAKQYGVSVSTLYASVKALEKSTHLS